MHGLALMHDEFGIRKKRWPVFPIGQARRVIRVHVRKDHGVDTSRIDASGPDVGQDLAAVGNR